MRRMMSLMLALLLLSLCAMAEAPDVITFTDPVLEAMIRKQMGRPEGNITASDAETVIELNMNREAEGDPAIRDISSLAPFVNLFNLSLIGHEITDISVLENMWNLKMLDLGGNNVTDLSPLSKLPLEVLAVWDNGVTDVSALAPIETLNHLSLNDNKIADFSPISHLTNLQYLYVRVNATDDYSALEGIYPGLKECDFDVMTTPFDKSEVIRFNDPVLEQRVRDALNIHDRDVTAGDAALLKDLKADADQNAPEESRVHDISALKYFVNLEILSLNNSAVADISALTGLKKLKGLGMLGGPNLDLEPIAGMNRMVWLGIQGNMQDVDFIADMPELESLRIDGLRNLPAGLPALHKLREFVSLGGEIEDISLLSQVPTLEVIDLSWNPVSDVTPLANLPLRELYLAGCPVEDYSPLKDLYPNLTGRSFEVFELAEPGNPDEIVAFPDPVMERKVREALGKPEGDITAKDAAQVTALHIQNEWQPQIPDDVIVKDIQGLQYFINLRELDAGFNDIGDISALSGVSQLRDLNLGGNPVGDIGALAGLANLESLTLFGGRFRDISPLGGLTSLRSLHLGGIPLADLSPLAGLTGIDHLYAGGCGIEDIAALAGMTNIYRLDLSDNFITDLSPLAGMTNLVMLKLANNPIGDYSPIEKLYPQLQEKDFELGQVFDVQVPLKPENPDEPVEITDTGLELILRQVTGVFDRPLTQMDLSRIDKFEIKTEYAQAVSDLSALRYCLNLRGLSIWESNVSDLSPLGGLTRLRHLTVNQSPLSDLSPLKSLTGLEHLDLAYNQITDLSPLYDLKNLSVLKISHNLTEDAGGFRDIAPGLKEKDFDPDKPMETGGYHGAGNQPEGQDQNAGLDQPKDPKKVIRFADKVMERRIREAIGKPEGKITAGDVAVVEELNLGNEYQDKFPKGSQITDLSGIEYFINLKRLDISWNKIKDIKKLSGLTKLEYLRAFGNQIDSVAPLKKLVNLNSLNIGGNNLTKIDALKELANLKSLYLDGNKIKDFSPIESIYPWLEDKDFTLGN